MKSTETPAFRYVDLKMEAALKEAKAETAKYAGRIGMMASTVWFLSGAFVAKCVIENNGTAEGMSDTRQGLILAGGGLAGVLLTAGAGLRSKEGSHIGHTFISRRERKKARLMSDEADRLLQTHPELAELSQMIVKDVALLKSQSDIAA